MRAIAVTPENRTVGIIDQPEPKIATPNQVKLRMIEAGVCGTDREICAFEYGTPPPGSKQLIILSATNLLVKSSRSAPGSRGSRPAIWSYRWCAGLAHDYCMACRAGRQDFCFTGDFTERGIKEQHGFMTQFVVADERFMNAVPPKLMDVAVLVEPLTIAEKGLAQVWDIQQRLPWGCAIVPNKAHKAVVLGAGPVGLLGALALVNADFDTWVYARERFLKPDPAERSQAQLGASERTEAGPISDLTSLVVRLRPKVGCRYAVVWEDFCPR